MLNIHLQEVVILHISLVSEYMFKIFDLSADVGVLFKCNSLITIYTQLKQFIHVNTPLWGARNRSANFE